MTANTHVQRLVKGEVFGRPPRAGALLALLLALGPAAAPAQIAETDAHLQSAVLSEDWAKLTELLVSVDSRTRSAVLRLVKAHACLALNRNNESLCLFLSASSDDDCEQWREWTQLLARDHADSVVAQYLQGDASARARKWDDALTSFDAALQRDQRHPLVLNARGVARAVIGRWNGARHDLVAATRAKETFAEAHASLGTYIIQRKTDATKARECFERSLRCSPDYVLALNGRGSCNVLVQNWEAASADLATASKCTTDCLSDLTPVVAMNLAVLADERNEYVARVLATVAGIEPGFSLDEKLRIFQSLPPEARQKAVDILNNATEFNRNRLGNLFTPDRIDLGLKLGIKGSVIGPIPFAEGNGLATWDLRAKSQFNLGQQSDLMHAIQDQFALKPNPINNLDAWANQHLLPGGDYGKLTSPKGWSSREIGEKPTDMGEWNVVTLYGLIYAVEARGACPTPKE